MKRAITLLRWILAGGALVLLMALVALLFYTRTENFYRLASDKVLVAINGSIRGTLSWRRISGSVWSGLRVDDLQLRYGDRVIFKSARTEIDYALLPLLWKRVQLTRLAATDPYLDLRKQADGEWNIVEALSSSEPSSGPFDWTIAIAGIELAGGEITLRPVAGKPELYWLRKLNIAGRARIADGLNVDLERLASWVDARQAPQVYVDGGLHYRQSGQSQSLQLASFWLQSRRSRVRLSGAIKNFTDFDSDLELAISHLAAADLAGYIPQWPAGFDITGAASTRGPLNALASKFDIKAAQAQLSGTVRVDLLSQSMPYSADVAIRGLALGQVVRNQEIAGVLSAKVKIAGAGSVIDTLNGTAEAQVRSLSVGARDLGAVSLQATLRGKAANVNGAIDGPMGRGTWSSQLSFTATPQYRADLELRAVNVAGLLQLKDSPGTKLNFDAKVNGAGFDLATMNSRATIEVLPSQWDVLNVERGRILAQVAGGQLKIDELRLRADGALLSAQGNLGLAAPHTGQINYQLQVADLGPWLRMVGRQGSGNLDLNGRVEGDLAELRTRGSWQSRGLKLAQDSVAAAQGDFVLQRHGGMALPSGTVNVALRDVHAAGVELAQLRAMLNLSAAPEWAIAIRADAQDSAGHAHRLVAQIDNPQGDFVLRASELTLTLSDGAWRLEGPATIARRGDNFLIDRLSVSNGRAQLGAEGSFALQGNQALTVRASNIPLAVLSAYLPQGADPTGALSGQVQLRGTAALPEIDADAQLSSGKIGGQNYQGMQAHADYRRQRVALDLTIDQDGTHNLQVRGTVPLALAWAPSWRAQPLPGLDLRARSAGLSLAFLNALQLPLENVAGQVALDVAVTGSLSEPQPQGTFQLSDGGFGVKPLGIRVTNANISGRADSSQLSIIRLTARSGAGTLEGSGVLALKQFAPQEMSLNLTARHWPAIQSERYSAIVNADLRLGGLITAPAISGKAEVLEGTVRPALDLLESHQAVSLKRDPTIVVVQQRGGKPVVSAGAENKQAAEQNNLWQALALQLRVAIPNNLWVRHPNANVELSGNLDVAKNPRSDVALTGRIEVVRGWFGFQGRRFELRRGLVQFTGGQPMNPTINVEGEYKTNNYLVTAVASGTASKPALTLNSQPQLAQSDILALLLFGKPTSELSGNEQLSLQQSAIGITAGFAAAQIGRAVSDALGLESLGVDIGDLNVSGGQVRFGRYVGGQTYVTASQEVSGQHGREFSLEYQLTPQIKVGASTNTSGNSGVDIIWHKRY